jgi:hypothetical protein
VSVKVEGQGRAQTPGADVRELLSQHENDATSLGPPLYMLADTAPSPSLTPPITTFCLSSPQVNLCAESRLGWPGIIDVIDRLGRIRNGCVLTQAPKAQQQCCHHALVRSPGACFPGAYMGGIMTSGCFDR